MILRDSNISGKFGGVSIGAIAYHSMKSINNLEGKVNNESFGYILQGKLDKYIKKASIEYILNPAELLPYRRFMQQDIFSGKTIVLKNKYDESNPLIILQRLQGEG